jgi:predicted GNAT superfamily acetyltransferase
LAREPAASPATIELPAELDLLKQSDRAAVAKVQARMREEFSAWFARGYAAVGVRKSAAGMAYLLAPWSDF